MFRPGSAANCKPMALRAYYALKPFIPRAARIAVRRWRAAWIRRSHASRWPIDSDAATPPRNWPGWPDGKRFAFVLSHDVEGQKGVDRCRELAELERAAGFRSSFNFVPEGEYSTPADLRAWLVGQGFEVGVHDLNHDGKLYSSRRAFAARAARINEYAKEWGAVGFRAGFMLHNLDWLRDLNVLYDASTFDTDPFEPQPTGMRTIFPFWVPDQNDLSELSTFKSQLPGSGYVELPYTLAQDITIFGLLGESSIDLWKQKVDWVVKHGGMVLANVHPDYIQFGDGRCGLTEFPAARYQELLDYVKEKYTGQFWHALPRDVAAFAREHRQVLPPPRHIAPSLARSRNGEAHRGCVWIDMDNTPHVPFFKPIVRELESRGYRVLLTARDAFQVCDLANEHGLRYTPIGRHHGKNRLRKAVGLFYRAFQMLPTIWKERPILAVSHGSRAQMIACKWVNIPSIAISDYEHAKEIPLFPPKWMIVNDVIPAESCWLKPDKIRKYPGLKEDVYVPDFRPDPSFLQNLGINPQHILVTLRPPATEAHYHNVESEYLFAHLLNRLHSTPNLHVVLLPRNKAQEEMIRQQWPDIFTSGKMSVPAKAVNGLDLVWHSDLVISGGGTMNREAAALGVPVYSIFRGKLGAVDEHLRASGRLIIVQSIAEVDAKIHLQRRERNLSRPKSAPALLGLVEQIEQILRAENHG
jgi:uncharacterized protein